MPRRKVALYAITMEADRVHRVVRAPHVLGWSNEDYRIWAKKLSYAYGECFSSSSKHVVFTCSEDLVEVRKKLKSDGMGNLEAFDNPEDVDFTMFNDVIAGKSL
ncbi:hypothetical protein ACFL3H_00325 [Gemmatimonadota bacterium]